MKAKTIKSVIVNKTNSWLDSIDDFGLRLNIKKNTIVTGGCIASMLLNEPVNDFDVYFRNSDTALAVAKYYVEKFKAGKGIGKEISVEKKDDRIRILIRSSGIASENTTIKENTPYIHDEQMLDLGNLGDIEDEYENVKEVVQDPEGKKEGRDSNSKYRPVFISSNAITLEGRVQLVFRFFGNPAEIHENYDFVHCTNYWTSWDNSLELNSKALEALLTKELIYVGSKYPLASLLRIRKFIKRGWTINAGQMLKIAMQLNDLELTNPTVLEDQLTGVDTAYFNEVLNKLQTEDPTKINTAYLVEIINRMF